MCCLWKVSKDDLMDSVQGLGQSITSASSIAGEALKRCLQFTEGAGFCGLIKALQVKNLIPHRKYWTAYYKFFKTKFFKMPLALTGTKKNLFVRVTKFIREDS